MKQLPPYIRFLLLAFAYFVSWELIYQLILSPLTDFDACLIHLQTMASYHLLQWLNFPVHFNSLFNTGYANSLWIEGSKMSLGVMRDCDAVELVSLYAAIGLAFPTASKFKLWIIGGVALIFFCNILRITSLVIIENTNSEWLEFNHVYTFNVSMYIIIMMLWYIGFIKVIKE